MKKLLSLFVGGVVGLFAGASVSAMDFYTDNGWNIAMEGEFAGYALYSGNIAYRIRGRARYPV